MELTFVHILIFNFAFNLFWNISVDVLLAKEVCKTIPSNYMNELLKGYKVYSHIYEQELEKTTEHVF